MTYNEFWNESLDRLFYYWQKNQFEIERRNQELWLQGIYVQEAVAAVQDTKHKVKYPDKPHRITALTEAEKEKEKKRKIDNLRDFLNSHKQNWDRTCKGADLIDGREH